MKLFVERTSRMKFVGVNVLLSGLCLSGLGLIVLGASGSGQALGADDTPLTTTIVLSDGTECYFAGQGATITFDGKRLNYTCSDTLGLIGDITITNSTDIALETATIDGTTITSSTPQALTIKSVVLADGSTCPNAAQGIRLAIQDQPLNYVCNSSDTDALSGLTGNITNAEGVFSVERITRQGFDLGRSETANIATLTVAEP